MIFAQHNFAAVRIFQSHEEGNGGKGRGEGGISWIFFDLAAVR
jgi:hypothetical protein